MLGNAPRTSSGVQYEAIGGCYFEGLVEHYDGARGSTSSCDRNIDIGRIGNSLFAPSEWLCAIEVILWSCGKSMRNGVVSCRSQSCDCQFSNAERRTVPFPDIATVSGCC